MTGETHAPSTGEVEPEGSRRTIKHTKRTLSQLRRGCTWALCQVTGHGGEGTGIVNGKYSRLLKEQEWDL